MTVDSNKHVCHTQHSQLPNIVILKFNPPVLLNQLSNIFPYRSSSTGSVLENTLPVELWVYFTVHSQQSWEYTGKYSPSCQSNTENQLFQYCSPRKDNLGIVIQNVCIVTRVRIQVKYSPSLQKILRASASRFP